MDHRNQSVLQDTMAFQFQIIGWDTFILVN